LWGEARVDRFRDYYNRNVEIWWRPTLGTEQQLKKYQEESQTRGATDDVQEYEQMLAGLAEARASGKPFWVEPTARNKAAVRPLPTVYGDPPALTTPVYVIVPGQCGSACLDAVDYFRLFPNTVLIGAPSSADSTYMEVRSAEFSSKLGATIVPMKMWVNRPRGNGVYYAPNILMAALDWSTVNFQRRIEEDIAKKAPK
jgi:hypothetical protein